MNNDDFMNALNAASLLLGIANYKYETMKHFEQATGKLLEVEHDLDEQNEMLREILKRLDKIERKR